MTAYRYPKKKKQGHVSVDRLLLGLFCIFLLLLILRNSKIAIDSVKRGLFLCAETLIPSLFPFLVLSEMIVSSGFGVLLLQRISKPLGRLLRLSPGGCCAVALGMLCGFPVGAKCAVRFFESGGMRREEASRVLAFSNNPSAAFLIGTVGGSLWGDAHFGRILYLGVLLSALLTGILLARLPHRDSLREQDAPAPLPSAPPVAPIPLFCNAIASASAGMLLICAYVVFFSALLGALQSLPCLQALPKEIQAAIFCALELSSGVARSSALSSPPFAALLTAAGVGWSGLSVHCQILSLCDGKGLSLRPYFGAKLLQALLCPAILFTLLKLLPS